MPVTDPNLISLNSQSITAPVASTKSYLVGLAAGTNKLPAAAVPAIALSALPFHIGWINWKDVAGTITIIGTGGTQAASVGFRSGTTAGDYILTLPTAMANANWIAAGLAGVAASIGVVSINPDVPLHSTTQLGFYIWTPSGLHRPDECLMYFIGAKV